jgi:PAS domain S-box-containing protein
MSIGGKLMLWMTSTFVLIGLLSTVLYFISASREESRKLESLGSTIGSILELSLDNYMMTRDLDSLHATLDSLKNIEPIDRIWLIDRRGTIRTSTDARDVGKRISLDDSQCSVCHEKNAGMHSVRTETLFRWAQPVLNKPRCHKCHDASVRNNGVFIIDFSLTEMGKYASANIRKGGIIFVPAILSIALMTLVISRRMIISRLNKVMDKIKGFKEGDYAVRTVLESDDEITELESRFNEMAETIHSRDNEKTDLLDEIRRNYDTQTVINALLRVALRDCKLEEILQSALDLILSISWLSLDSKGAIFLMEDDADTLLLKAHKGLTEPLLGECAKVPKGRCLCGRAALTQEVQFTDMVDERHTTHYEGMASHGHYCVPILFAGKTLGVLNMYLGEGHRRDEKEEEFLKAIAYALAGIIQRKQMELEHERLIRDLKITLEKVSRSQKMWQETFDSIGDLISIHDDDFNIIKINRAFADFFGLQPKQAINRKCYDFFHGGDSPPENCPNKISLRKNRTESCEILDKKSGRIFLISTFPFHFHDASFRGTVHVAKDVTESREKEVRLLMSERLAALGQMAAGIAHEINNPLAAIAGCTEGLHNRVRKGKYDPKLFTNYLSIIEEEILRCKNITTGMLSFVRKASYDKKNVDLNVLFEKTLEIVGFQGRLKIVKVIRKYSDPLPAVYASEGELKQVFLAVIINALDSMKDCGTLTVETGSEGSKIFIKVGDTGPGISQEDKQKIFDPFFTTKSNIGGTGLGLSIARKIISNHMGSIDVSTADGKGTTFTITLPLS